MEIVEIVKERLDIIKDFNMFDELIYQSLIMLEPTDFTRVIFNSIVELKLYSYLMIKIDDDEYFDIANGEVNKYKQYVQNYITLHGDGTNSEDIITNSINEYCHDVIQQHGLEKLIEIFITLGGTDKIKTLDYM